MTATASPRGGDTDLEVTAARFARRGAAEAETVIAALAAEAIRHWRLDEATFWQRVKFRARMLRATRDGAAPHRLGGETTC